VFGAAKVSVSVSVAKGDSVTLHTNVSELQNDDIVEWMREDNVIIAEVKNKKHQIKTNNPRNNSNESFDSRLVLDHKTGSLTIVNITSQDEGIYIVDISFAGGHLISKNFRVTVHDDVHSVSVMEDDSVTLHTGVTKILRDDVIQWFGDRGAIIARLTYGSYELSVQNKSKQKNFGTSYGLEQVNGLNSAGDSGWSNAHLSNKTGDLTIKTIQMKQSGVYKVEINTNTMVLHRKFKITVGASKIMSVKEGESVTLHTGLIDILRYDLISWKFEDDLVAEINKGTNRFLVCENADVRFKGRLQLNEKTGSLTISGSETTDSGDYHLNMSNQICTLHRTIIVTVKATVTPKGFTEEPGLHPVYTALICVCIVLVAVTVAFVIYCHRKRVA
ncbi:uncharacterized protein LOC122335895, partial [Puntigrus tetrazona]|uniref:uncharacterized protein LOC122335895 n=1 Tax=Puntigrus tetrazona TaxID=1606681 RepID=UPI001C8AEA15